MYRIEGAWVEGRTSAFGQTFELVAGFTEKSYIAGGNWFGAVKDFDTIYPFVLTDDGYCRYAGVRAEARYFSIVKRPVKVGKYSNSRGTTTKIYTAIASPKSHD